MDHNAPFGGRQVLVVASLVGLDEGHTLLTRLGEGDLCRRSDRLGAEGACRVGGQEFPGAQGAYLAYVGFPVFRLGKRPLCPLRRSPERPSIRRENGGALRFLGRGSQMGKWRKTWELMGFRL